MDDKELIWEEVDRKFLADYRIFKAYQVDRVNYQGRVASFYELDPPDWATVITRDEKGRFLMVRQFRMGSADLSIEFPAGVIEPEESPQKAALRELEEETGYRASSIKQIGTVNPNPAFMHNISHTFLAEDLEFLNKTQWDENEIIQILWMTEEEIDKTMGSAEMNSAIMVQAWYWYKNLKKG